MDDILRRIWSRLNSIVSLGVVDRRAANGTHQVLFAADRVSSGVEHLEPQGIHFAVPVDAQGLLLSPAGVKAASVLVGAGGAVPGGALAAGEGGLHYLGTFKVFLAANGHTLLGSATAARAVAAAPDVDQQLNDLKTAISGWTPIPNDGGAALKAALSSWCSNTANTGSPTVKVP